MPGGLKTSDVLKGVKLYKESVSRRRELIRDAAALSEENVEALGKCGELSEEVADRMIENVIGTYSLPVGVATNFRINGSDYVIPFVVEEASVVAAASNAAKRCLQNGGFVCEVDDPIMIGQIEIRDAEDALEKIRDNESEIRKVCNEAIGESMLKRGGGFRGMEVRKMETLSGSIVVTHLLIDCRDAMGANLVNTACEAAAPTIADLCGGSIGLRILSNLATRRLARATATFTASELAQGLASDEGLVDAILKAYHFAVADPFRACTHNKGVMNAISAVALACGQDWRAIEAAAHAYCAWKQDPEASCYGAMTSWTKDPDTGDLIGSIELPMPVGLVGGAVKLHPAARANIAILGISNARDLACVLVSAGLAQNLAALRALATVGIQQGHMRLHARSRADQKS